MRLRKKGFGVELFMKTIYLLRHAQPQLVDYKSRCISKTDIPLDVLGSHQAARLHIWALLTKITAIFSSPLKRCLQTANIMSGGEIPVQIHEQLHEMDVGLWENLSFDEIRAKYPEEYAARGKRPGTIPPTGGESIEQAGKRLVDCLDGLLRKTNGDIAVMAHGGINRGALCRLMGRNPDEVLEIPQPYCGISELQYYGPGKYAVVSVGLKPDRQPSAFERDILYKKHGTPPEIQAHCLAVKEKAISLAAQITDRLIDLNLLQVACELHDIAKTNVDHAARGAEILRHEGYPHVSALIATHHDLPPGAGIESRLLYLADKLVIGTRFVSLEERFEESAKKCNTPGALNSWKQRFQESQAIIELYSLNLGS